MSRPSVLLRLRVMARLLRCRFWKSKPWRLPPTTSPWAEPGGSILITAAPQSASWRTAVGPARCAVRSSTVRSASGMLVMVIPFSMRCERGASGERSLQLLALEVGRALLHECAAALDIILAVEARFDHAIEPREIPLRLGLADLARGGLGKGNCQWRVLG